jgi:hypothetical protein
MKYLMKSKNFTESKNYLSMYDGLGKPEVGNYEESNKMKLQVGDYVICEDRGLYSNELVKFINNNIGQYIIMNDGFYIIKYENTPEELKNIMVYYNSQNKKYYDCVIMEKSEIKYWSKNKEDLYIYLDINKYNV